MTSWCAWVSGLDALKGLLDSLLDVSQAGRGRRSGRRSRPCRSAPLVRGHIAAAYAPAAAAKGLALSRGAVLRPRVVCSDRILLARIVRNLVENAVALYGARKVFWVDCLPAQGPACASRSGDTGDGHPARACRAHLGRIPPDQQSRARPHAGSGRGTRRS